MIMRNCRAKKLMISLLFFDYITLQFNSNILIQFQISVIFSCGVLISIISWWFFLKIFNQKDGCQSLQIFIDFQQLHRSQVDDLCSYNWKSITSKISKEIRSKNKNKKPSLFYALNDLIFFLISMSFHVFIQEFNNVYIVIFPPFFLTLKRKFHF
jgi:hypothetical protein